MFDITLPVLEKLEKERLFDILSFKIKSSIFESIPTFILRVKSSNYMPDDMRLLIGSALDCKYETGGKKKSFPDLYLKNIKMTGDPTTMYFDIFYYGALLFLQRSDERVCTKNKYANEVLNDIFDKLPFFKNNYELIFKKSENYATLYRSLGTSDLEFINNQVCKNYSIQRGTPLFFTGLDKKITLTSINEISNRTEKAKVVVKLCSNYNGKDREFINKQVKSIADKNYTELTSTQFWMDLGENFEGLKPSAYYSPFDSDMNITSAYDFNPSKGGKDYFPVSKNFLNMIETTDAQVFINRPKGNILFETRSHFKSFEDLIKFKIKITDLSTLNHLIVAGDKIMLCTANAHSGFNGAYLVSEIAYGKDKSIPFCEMTVIRPNLDLNFEPSIPKMTLYNC